VDDLDELASAVAGACQQVKSLQRMARTTSQVLTDLRERLDAARLDAQPEEAQRNGSNPGSTEAPVAR
jgi:hypothetical protein